MHHREAFASAGLDFSRRVLCSSRRIAWDPSCDAGISVPSSPVRRQSTPAYNRIYSTLYDIMREDIDKRYSYLLRSDVSKHAQSSFNITSVHSQVCVCNVDTKFLWCALKLSHSILHYLSSLRLDVEYTVSRHIHCHMTHSVTWHTHCHIIYTVTQHTASYTTSCHT